VRSVVVNELVDSRRDSNSLLNETLQLRGLQFLPASSTAIYKLLLDRSLDSEEEGLQVREAKTDAVHDALRRVPYSPNEEVYIKYANVNLKIKRFEN